MAFILNGSVPENPLEQCQRSLLAALKVWKASRRREVGETGSRRGHGGHAGELEQLTGWLVVAFVSFCVLRDLPLLLLGGQTIRQFLGTFAYP